MGSLAYDLQIYYKIKTNEVHNSRVLREEFKVGYKVLLFYSKIKLIAGKLKTRWFGQFEDV